MHRKELLILLTAYEQRFPEEGVSLGRFQEFVETNPQCFERFLQKGHITGSAWLIDSKEENVLLTHHKKLKKWFQLGGHSDGNPNTLEVALSEAKEESGIKNIQIISKEIFDIDIHLIPEGKTEPAHYHYDVRFAFKVVGNEEFILSEESLALAWIPISNLSKKTKEESMLRMGRKHRERRSLMECIS